MDNKNANCDRCGVTLKFDNHIVRIPSAFTIAEHEVYLLCESCYGETVRFSKVIDDMATLAKRMFIKNEADNCKNDTRTTSRI